MNDTELCEVLHSLIKVIYMSAEGSDYDMDPSELMRLIEGWLDEHGLEWTPDCLIIPRLDGPWECIPCDLEFPADFEADQCPHCGLNLIRTYGIKLPRH